MKNAKRKRLRSGSIVPRYTSTMYEIASNVKKEMPIGRTMCDVNASKDGRPSPVSVNRIDDELRATNDAYLK